MEQFVKYFLDKNGGILVLNKEKALKYQGLEFREDIILAGGDTGIYAVSIVLANEIWFVLGMSICTFNVQILGKKLQGVAIGLLFLGLSVAVDIVNVRNLAVSFVLGLIACTAVILLVVACEEKSGKAMGFLSKHTMPIFLMHTLFAAPLRSVLLKIGITNAAIHVV